MAGDHYGGEFVKEPFRKHGISYELCKRPKSDLYRDLLPSLNSGQIVLPRHDRLVAQIGGLERRTGRSGKDSIDHAPGAHDDLANCVAGVAHIAGGRLVALGPSVYHFGYSALATRPRERLVYRGLDGKLRFRSSQPQPNGSHPVAF